MEQILLLLFVIDIKGSGLAYIYTKWRTTNINNDDPKEEAAGRRGLSKESFIDLQLGHGNATLMKKSDSIVL